MGNPGAINEDFHITTDRAFTWKQIHEAIARGLGAEAIHAHVPADSLVRFKPEWKGGLFGDKIWSALFDNAKVKAVVGEFGASQDLDEILAESIRHAGAAIDRPLSPEALAEDQLMDRIVAAQAAVRP